MPHATTRVFTLCADDFGLAPDIDRAILKLAARGRISAVSCMSGGASWRQNAPELARMGDRLDVGLHLTLTELRPLGPMPHLAAGGVLPDIGSLLRRTLLQRLDPTEIRNEARRQIDTFCQYFGHPPAHIDGHQHIHCFPIIRTAVYEMAQEYGCYVRNCATDLSTLWHGAASWAKAAVINGMGCGFKAGLAARQIPHNRIFFGLHDFNPARDIRAMYASWLRYLSDGTLYQPPDEVIHGLRLVSAATAAAAAYAAERPDELSYQSMSQFIGPQVLINCHPGEDKIPGDALANWRRHEAEFLQSAAFADLLQETNASVVKFKPPATPNG